MGHHHHHHHFRSGGGGRGPVSPAARLIGLMIFVVFLAWRFFAHRH